MLAALAVVAFTYWIEPCNPQQRDPNVLMPERRDADSCEKGDEQLADWAIRAWGRAAAGGLQFSRVSDKDQALLRVSWEPAVGGLYGEAMPIMVGNRRGAELHIRSDLRGLGTDFVARGSQDRLFRDTIVYLTVLHESGHALGLQHTREYADIMYSFQFGGDLIEYFDRYRRRLSKREDFAKGGGYSPEDEKRLRALYPSK